APGEMEAGALRGLIEADDAQVIVGSGANPHDPRPGQRTERAQVRVVAVHHDKTVARNDAGKMAESPLHVGQVAKNVGVVEFEIVEHRDVRRVMDELAALIEESAVVFVALNHEGVGGGAEMAAGGRILRHSADEITGVAAVAPEQKCRQRGGGGLAMRAANDEIAAAA